MSKKKSLLILLLCGIVFFTIGVGSSSSSGDLDINHTDFDDTSEENKQEEVIEIIEKNGYLGSDGKYYIEGKAKNISEHRIGAIVISFNVYDEEQAVVGTCIAQQLDINAGQTWRFQAKCSGNGKYVKSFVYTGYDAL